MIIYLKEKGMNKSLLIALGASLSLGLAGTVYADATSVQAEKLNSGYAQNTAKGNCGCTSCAEKCGTKKSNCKCKSGKCTTGKCGTGKCGTGKCGSGKCGSGKGGSNK